MRQGRQTLVGTPPPAKRTFKSKSYDLRNAEEKIFKLLLFGFALFPGLLLFIFFSISTVPPVEPVSERHPSLSHTSPNHHSPRLVGIPSTKRLHSKQKLGLEKLCKNLPFFWCCFWVCRHLTSMMKLFKIHRPPIEPISETHPPASNPHPPHLASPVGRKEETLPTKLLHSSQKLQLEKLKNEHFVFALFSSLPQFHFSDSIIRLPHRTHFCKASPSCPDPPPHAKTWHKSWQNWQTFETSWRLRIPHPEKNPFDFTLRQAI